MSLTLLGGYGFESRMWGLAVDSITGLEAVIPQEDNATVVTYDTSSDQTMALWVSDVPSLSGLERGSHTHYLTLFATFFTLGLIR